MKIKRIVKLGVVSLMTVCLMACTQKAQNKVVESAVIEPKTSQMKTICELATMDCYFKNVAKYEQKDAEGMLWWKKDKKFWIEYSGIVRVGIDASKVDMTIVDDKVTVTLPKAKILDAIVDQNTLTKSSFITARHSAKVKAQDQTEVLKKAQEEMKRTAEEDTMLLANAEERVEKLLEDYISNIGKMLGKSYTTEYQYIAEGE